MSHEMEFKVMTMNIRFGLADDGENSWPFRRHFFAELFKRHPATFLGIQESNHFQTEYLNRLLDKYHGIGWHNPSHETWQSNLIFYQNTWKCIEHRHLFLSETPDTESKLPGSKWPRQCVMGLFEHGETRLIAANTHFDFDPSVQRKSAELVVNFLSGFPKAYPVVIMGDFNTSPESSAYTVFMENGFSEVLHDNYTSTFHGFKGGDTGEHIDWILHRGPLTLKRAMVLKDSFSDRFPSDHYPVMASFTLSKQ